MPPNPLQGARFVLAAHTPEQLPPDAGAEVAFAGRSNAGKSSALNALTGQRALARTSKTPGRTQQMVVFELDPERRLVDLPGYGYAKVPQALREHWRQAIDAYLHRRRALRGLVLIIDIRHPLKDFDRQMLAFCAETGLACHCLLTKADKLSRAQVQAALRAFEKTVAAEGWDAGAQAFSAHDATGVEAARAAVMRLFETERERR